jgi:acyl-CoA thioesterase I
MRPFRFALILIVLAASVTSSLAVQIKIACVGDSITEGSGLSNPTTESYPAKLGRLLGTNYVVRNFGVSGRTLLKKGDFPYWKEVYYKTSRDWQPDVVIIQLGTNDSKPYNWRYGTNFVSDYEDLIASYASLPSQPRVIVCSPCPVYNKGAYDISPGVVATNITPIVYDLASRLDLDVVDLQTRLAGHSEWFPDTVHPNSKGMTAMAAVMFSGLMGITSTPAAESLSVQRVPSNRSVLRWSADARILIPQTATALRGTNTAWTVSESVIYLNGENVSQTNTLSGTAKFYRLWQP